MSDTAPNFIARGFDQICFVVKDLDKAMDYWTKVNGVTNWQVVDSLANGQLEKELWGKPAEFDHTCAYGAVGNMLVELALPTSGHSLYDEWLEEGRTGPHHLGFLVAPEEYDQATDVYTKQGFVKAMSGLAGKLCRWSYWDTREQIGCFTELYWVAPEAMVHYKKFMSGESSVLMPG